MVDLVIINAVVWTAVPGAPFAEAVAVADGRILRTGTTASLRALAGPETRIYDARGGLVCPGFCDCHTHFLLGGFSLSNVRLRDVRTREEFAARIAAKARELDRGEWILNGDWDHEQFRPVELPRREWIDAVSPDNPVCVTRYDGHMALANSAALEAAGITKDTPAPPGGAIIRDPSTGGPTGILKDAAVDLVLGRAPAPSMAAKIRAAQAALRNAAAHGVTSVHEMADAASFEVYQELDRAGRMTARLTVYLPITEVDALVRLRMKTPFGSEFVKIGGLKGFMDGSLGSSSALFFEPYDDEPRNSGLLSPQMFPEGIMEKRIMEADRAGLQVAVHAIGDKAIALLLDIYERAAAAHGPRDRRWRIEHVQHPRPGDIPRLGKLGVVASVQPYHAFDDGRWAERKVGKERARTTYPFRSIRDAGARLAFGSDWTVAPLDPILGIHAAVTRETADGKHPDGWIPGEKLPLEDALRAFTTGGAYAEFAEGTRGTLADGMKADLVLLDGNLFALPPSRIREAKVVLTVAGGRTVYDAGGGRI